MRTPKDWSNDVLTRKYIAAIQDNVIESVAESVRRIPPDSLLTFEGVADRIRDMKSGPMVTIPLYAAPSPEHKKCPGCGGNGCLGALSGGAGYWVECERPVPCFRTTRHSNEQDAWKFWDTRAMVPTCEQEAWKLWDTRAT